MRHIVLLVALAGAALVTAGAQATTSKAIDLASGRVDGHRILGLTVPQVVAALGRPDFRVGPRSRYRIGYGAREDFAAEVMFRPSGGVERAWSIVFERGRVRDPAVGDVLRPSAVLQKAILDAYGAKFRLVRPYGCRGRECVGEFAARNGPIHLTFGTLPATGTWLTIWSA